MFTRVLKMSFWVSYDHLGKLLVANVCCALGSALPVVVGLTLVSDEAPPWLRGLGAASAGMGILLTPVLFVALLHLVKVCIDTGDAALADFFTGIRRYGVRAGTLAGIYFALAACLIAGAWFYPAQLGERAPLVGYVLGGFAALALVVLALSALYAGPALVNRPTGAPGALQLAFVLALDNPVYTLSLAFAAGCVAIVAVAPPVLAFAAYAALAVLQASAYEMLARAYAAPTEAGNDKHREVVCEGGSPADDYLNRGWGDLLHPWKL